MVHTEVAALKRFWIAEDYHQKYRLRHEPELYDELRALYPEEGDFVNSTAAARINGFLDGHASARRLAADIDRLGLSPAGIEQLRAAAR